MNRYCPNKLTYSILAVATALLLPLTIQAAPADGAGPWADSVVSSSQGNRKDGSPVLVVRSNPEAAVGVAENTNADGTFFSLGFGGQLVLRFDNGVSGGVIAVEATNMPYPVETAEVSVSPDGTNWVVAGSVNQDGQVSMPQSVSCAKYVKIVDTSVASNFSDVTADGYDVDGISSLNSVTCEVPTSGGGNATVTINNKSICKISQQTGVGAVTTIQNMVNTGKNTIKKTTGKNAKIKTGAIQQVTTVNVTGGSNHVGDDACCCGNGSSVQVSIINN